MIHKKGASSTTNSRDSEAKRLSVERFGGQQAKAGEVLVRQRGTSFYLGRNAGRGGDGTLFALKADAIESSTRRNHRITSIVENNS